LESINKHLILCVDDEKIILDSLKKELSPEFRNGYIIEIAETASEAIEIVGEAINDGWDIPVVLSDYIMPGTKGDELLKIIKNVSPNTYCIMLTGQATIEGVTNAINNSTLYRYISKPWETNDLLLTISEAIKSYNQDKELKLKTEEILQKNKEILEINLHLEELVKKRTAELEEKKQEIEDSINYSRRIQMAIMGDINSLEKQFPFICMLYLPKDVVSGDFYWYSKNDGKIILVAADCTGHGVPGAFMSIVGMSALNEIINEKHITQPNIVLNYLRKRIVNILSQTGKDGESKDGMDISIIVIDMKEMTLEYAGAFNSLYFVKDSFSGFDTSNNPNYLLHNDSLLEIKADRMPIGFSDSMETEYTLNKVSIQPKDVFYILTDGYTDQIGGENQKKFLLKRFREKIVSIRDYNIEMQKRLLNDTINVWKGNNEQVDDILVIGLKVPENLSNFTIMNYESRYENVVFDYTGKINRSIFAVMLDEIEDKLINIGLHKKHVKKIIIVITELIENTINYFYGLNEIFEKIFFLTIKRDGKYFSIECVNSINLIGFNVVKAKIDKLNLANDEKLQQLYKQQLKDGVMVEGRGAGLGLIVIAQRSLKPITCELINIKSSSIMKLNLVISCE
jgi:serine phosphatase RsbU (regulator of sigma subunit)